MFKGLTSLSKLMMVAFVLLVLNCIYSIGYLGHMIISSEYSVDINLSTLISLFYLMVVLTVFYAINSFFAKRVKWNTARVILDDLPGLSLLADEKIDKIPSLKDQISVYKNKFMHIINLISEYDKVFVVIKFNYIVVVLFSLIVTVFNYKQINVTAYIIVEVFVLLCIAIATYISSNKAKSMLKSISRELEEDI